MRPELCRLYVPHTNAEYASLYASGTNWLSDSLLATSAPGAAPTYAGWFADNVFSLWFRVLDVNGNPITKNADAVPFAAGSYDSRAGYRLGTNRVEGPALPASVEVAVVVADGTRLWGNGQTFYPPAGLGTDPTRFWEDIQASMADLNIPRNIRDGLQVYSRRIPLRYAQ